MTENDHDHEQEEIGFTSDVAKKLLVAVLSSSVIFLGGWFWRISTIVEDHGHTLADVKPAIEQFREMQREVAVIRQIQVQEQQLISEIRNDLREMYKNKGAR